MSDTAIGTLILVVVGLLLLLAIARTAIKIVREIPQPFTRVAQHRSGRFERKPFVPERRQESETDVRIGQLFSLQ